MKTIVRIGLVLLATLLATRFLWVFRLKSHEPTYQGKQDKKREVRHHAALALQKIKTPAGDGVDGR